MFSRDDDLDEPVSSNRKALEHADHGKAEKVDQRKRSVEKKELQRLRLDVLRKQVAPQKTDEKKETKQDDDAGTKTRAEEERQTVDTAQAKPDPEKLIKKEERQEAVKKQAAIEQSKDKAG
jgi:hypothetical protein